MGRQLVASECFTIVVFWFALLPAGGVLCSLSVVSVWFSYLFLLF